MAIEGTRQECCWHVIKVVPYLQARNQGSTLFAEGDTPNTIITYNFWREQRLIVVDPNSLRHLRLDTINREQLLALNDT